MLDMLAHCRFILKQLLESCLYDPFLMLHLVIYDFIIFVIYDFIKSSFGLKGEGGRVKWSKVELIEKMLI